MGNLKEVKGKRLKKGNNNQARDNTLYNYPCYGQRNCERNKKIMKCKEMGEKEMKNKMLIKIFSLFFVISLFVVVTPTVMSYSYQTTENYNYDKDYSYEYKDYNYYRYTYYDYSYYPYYNYIYKNYYCRILNLLENLCERFPALEYLYEKFIF